MGFETGAAIPPHYGEDRLGVIARDAAWLYCYWELEGGTCQRIIDKEGRDYLPSARWLLRVIPEGEATYDVEVDPTARNHYLEARPSTRYALELGARGPDGAYHLLAAAAPVRTPPPVGGPTGGGLGMELKDEIERLREFVAGGSSIMSIARRGYVRTLRRRRRRSPAGGAATATHGYLMPVLHAHLPFVRHPEYERFLEEDWLFEAITETYVPLADMFDRLFSEGVRARAVVTLSPTLCEMMSDKLLQRRYSAHLDRLIRCADEALARMKGSESEGAAEMYATGLRHVRTVYLSWDRNMVHAYRSLADRGVVDVLACAATHGILPLMKEKSTVAAQIELGCRNYEKHFGRRPRGMWLPECAYVPGIDEAILAAGLKYTFVDSHGVLNADPAPRSFTYRPIVTPGGVAAFARDPETGVQVWSAEHGFPGDPVYREFYRDLGYDGDYDMVRPCLHTDGMRRNIGLKYHRVTGRVPLEEKEPYVPEWASRCASAHADYFVSSIEARVANLRDILGEKPVICSMYDAELFGHWWYEGVEFLEHVFRRAARPGSPVEIVTPAEYLDAEPSLQVASVGASSWGDKGYFEHWLNGSNDWIYPHLHKAEERMRELARRFPNADGDLARALSQAARELLLAQSSDWAFLMSTGTATQYAVRRTRDHIAQFTRMYDMLVAGKIDVEDLGLLENRDSLFAEIDYRVFAGRAGG